MENCCNCLLILYIIYHLQLFSIQPSHSSLQCKKNRIQTNLFINSEVLVTNSIMFDSVTIYAEKKFTIIICFLYKLETIDPNKCDYPIEQHISFQPSITIIIQCKHLTHMQCYNVCIYTYI